MGDAELFQALQPFNAHWTTGAVSGLIRKNPRKRRAVGPLFHRAQRLPFHVLVGPRQVGKTTVIGHLMAALLESGVAREHVLYVLADSPQIALELSGRLDPLVRCLERFVLKAPLDSLPAPAYLFVDEVHTLGGWDVELKALYDRYHPHLRVFASGSSSAALKRADLPGRLDRSELYPMKFSETLEQAAPATAALLDKARGLRHAVDWRAKPQEVKRQLAESLHSLFVDAQPHLSSIRFALDEYMIRGGYPAAQPPIPETEVYDFFETGLNTVLAKDLSLFERVRKPDAFRSFVAQLARNHGGKFSPAKYSKELGLDASTPATWIEICERMFLVRRLEALNEGFRPLPRKADKTFIQDPGLLNFLSGNVPLAELFRTGKSGLVMEGILFDHLKRLQFNAHRGRGGVIGYVDKPEVDFAVQLPSLHLAVESKFSERSPRGSARLSTLYGSDSQVLPMIITQSPFSVDGDVWEIPAWLLLMAC